MQPSNLVPSILLSTSRHGRSGRQLTHSHRPQDRDLVPRVLGNNPHSLLFASASRHTRLIHFFTVTGVAPPFLNALFSRRQWWLIVVQGIQMREEVGKAFQVALMGLISCLPAPIIAVLFQRQEYGK